VVTTAAVEASLQIGYPAGIGIRHFLIFARTSLMRAASLSASQPARRWSDGEKARCFSAVQNVVLVQVFGCRHAETIRHLVDEFYIKVRADRELGPIFVRAIPGDWGEHLATMRDFWSSVMLTSARYKGNPFAVHQRMEGIELQLFDRWLALFDETCGELFDETTGAAFSTKARRIAESLKLALFYRPDQPWPRSAP